MTGGLRMIKLVYVIRSRDDVPRAEFHRYWREEHAAKARNAMGGTGITSRRLTRSTRPLSLRRLTPL